QIRFNFTASKPILIPPVFVLIGLFPLQAMGAPVMRIGACLHFFAQMQDFLDLGNQALVFENAPVGEDGEFPGGGMVHHSSARILFVLGATGNSSAALELCPNTNVAAGMCQVVHIRLRFAQQRTVDDQLAIYEPEDSETRCILWLPS